MALIIDIFAVAITKAITRRRRPSANDDPFCIGKAFHRSSLFYISLTFTILIQVLTCTVSPVVTLRDQHCYFSSSQHCSQCLLCCGVHYSHGGLQFVFQDCSCTDIIFQVRHERILSVQCINYLSFIKTFLVALFLEQLKPC